MQSFTIKTRFSEVAALRTSATQGPPVLALHGWLDNAASFQPLMEKLSDLNIVAIDLPGHGLSTHRDISASYLFVDWVREVSAVADALGWRQFHLLGHSMGAGIASLAAVADPERILTYCGLDGFLPLPGDASDVVSRLQDYVRDSWRERRQISFPSADAALESRARAGEFENVIGLKGMVVRGLEIKNNRWVLRFDRRLLSHNPLRFTMEHLEHLTAGLTMPVTVVVADRGLDFVKKQIAVLSPRVKTFSTVPISGYHHVHLDAPERLAPILKKIYVTE